MPQLLVLSGNKQGFVLELGDGDVVDVGNRKTAKLSIRDPWISWNHAKVVGEGGRYFVEDLGSSNGTWVAGEKVQRRELKPSDVIYFGKTKVKFALDGAGGAAAPSSGPAPSTAAGAPAPGAGWWEADAAGLGDAPEALKRAFAEERRMRQALERFLELPEGSSVGDVARAGALEREVEALRKKVAELEARPTGPDPESVERMRTEHTAKVVELESKAAAAEARAVDLEGRLKDRSEQAKREVARARETAQQTIDELKAQLEAAQQQASELASGGDAALQGAQDRVAALEQELAGVRERLQAAEQKADDLTQELAAAQAAAPSGGGEVDALKGQLAEALAQAAHWEEEHRKVVQEIDEISMEQIEIEDELKRQVEALKARLGEGDDPPDGEAAFEGA